MKYKIKYFIMEVQGFFQPRKQLLTGEEIAISGWKTTENEALQSIRKFYSGDVVLEDASSHHTHISRERFA